jgi:hypothetical protein
VGIPQWWRGLATPVVMASVYLVTVGSYLTKRPCTGPPYDAEGSAANEFHPHPWYCGSDIQNLWRDRRIDLHGFPYVDGFLDGGWLHGGAVEYPVLTGLFMWVTGLPADNDGQFMAYTAAVMLPIGLLVGWMLAQLVGWRGLVFAAAPSLLIYAVYNWDLLPVAWTLAAVLAWRRGRHAWAGVFLGLGAATKIYPGFFLLPLVIERWAARDRKGAVLVALAGAGAWLVVNAPFMVINFEGWWATYAFQAARNPDLTTNSIYFWGVPEWTQSQVNQFSAGAIAACWLGALIGGWVRRRGPEGYPWIQVSAAMLFSFLAFNKVYSPQYALWVLPFLALIALRWGWWIAFWCVDVVLFVGLLRWYHTGSDQMRQAASIGGWGKSVLFMLLFFAVLVTPLAVRRRSPAEPAPPTPDDPARPEPALAG